MKLKRNWIVFPVILLVLAGMMMSCGDDDTPAEKFKVTFDKNTTDEVTGLPAVQSVEKGKKAKEPAAPVRAKYDFTGWYKDKNGAEAWDFSKNVVTKAITLYAGWEYVIQGNLGKFTIINKDDQKGWVTNGTDDIETDLDIVTFINAKYLVLGLSAAPTGGVHLIWQADGNNWSWDDTAISSDLGVFDPTKGAVWDEDTLTVTIDLELALKNYSGIYNSYKAKFFIAYYSPDVDALGILTADLVEKTPAQGLKEFVFVTFDSDGGNFQYDSTKPVEATRIIRVEKGHSIASFLPDPLKEGFVLTGWKDAAGAAVSTGTAISADATYTAIWTAGAPTMRTVTFNSNGGTAVASISVPNNTRISTKYPADPTKEGFLFDGWKDASNDDVTAQTIVKADITATAQWKAGWSNGKAQLEIPADWKTDSSQWDILAFKDNLKTNAYLVFEIRAGSENWLGGVNVCFNGPPTWKQVKIVDGDGMATSNNHKYIIVNLKKIPDYNLASNEYTWLQLIVQAQYGGDMLKNDTTAVFITNKALNTGAMTTILADTTWFTETAIWD